MTELTPDRDPMLARAADLHGRILTFDSHVDIPQAFGSPEMPADRDGDSQFDLVKAQRGRLSGAGLVIHAPVARLSAEAAAAGRLETEQAYVRITGIAERFPDRAGLARTPAAFRRLAADGRFAIVLAYQNAAPLGDDLSWLDRWAARGVTMFAFSFIGNNSWADSARPYPFISGGLQANGLSDIGKAAVRRLNDLGVIVDVSQMSSPALADVLAVSRAPIVASHSAVRALVDADRNLSDAELDAIAAGGGVVQIVGFAPYVRVLDPDLRTRLEDLWEAEGLARPTRLSDVLSVNDPATATWPEDRFWRFLHEFHVMLDLEHPTATVSDLVDAIDHAVARVGIDHVGIASDFNHAGGLADWTDVGQNLNVTAELLRRGYAEADIAKLWGENFLRVWQAVIDCSRPAQDLLNP
jgi:microsomal dipeptidase-like Zn-dependent dipeptidase